jgi:hypothetical protein
MGRAVVAFGFLAIDISPFGEDQVTAGGALLEREVSMTHLQLCLKSFE